MKFGLFLWVQNKYHCKSLRPAVSLFYTWFYNYQLQDYYKLLIVKNLNVLLVLNSYDFLLSNKELLKVFPKVGLNTQKYFVVLYTLKHYSSTVL